MEVAGLGAGPAALSAWERAETEMISLIPISLTSSNAKSDCGYGHQGNENG